MKLKLRLYYKISLITLLFITGLFIAAFIFPALDMTYSASRSRHQRDKVKMAWLKCFALIVNLQSIKEGTLLDKPGLLVSNHVSWLDIIVLGAYLPACFVAKSDILDWPVIGYLAKKGDAIFIRRGDKKQVQSTAEQMIWPLKQNCAVIAFPEGTTTEGDVVLPFHASLFQPAILTGANIQPVALHYLGAAKDTAPFIGEDAFVPHLIKMLSLDKIEVRVDFLPGINTSGKNRRAISDEARAKILDSISGEQQSLAITTVNTAS